LGWDSGSLRYRDPAAAFRIARISSTGLACVITYPHAPFLSAWMTYWSLEYIESMITAVAGDC